MQYLYEIHSYNLRAAGVFIPQSDGGTLREAIEAAAGALMAKSGAPLAKVQVQDGIQVYEFTVWGDS